MARKRRGRRSRRGFVAIPFNAEVSLSTLSNNVAIAAGVSGTFGEDLYILSVDCTWSLRDQVATEGPLEVGFHHGDLSVTELNEALDASVTDPDDIIQRERARRPVRKVGAFNGLVANETLNDGKMIRTRIKFSVGDGHAFAFYVMNRSNAVKTGDAGVEVEGVIYGRWQR